MIACAQLGRVPIPSSAFGIFKLEQCHGKRGRAMRNGIVRYGTLFAVYVSLSSPAYAYLDGATASILLQAVIGGVATWVVYSRSLLAKGKAYVARILGRSDRA